jgi:hypothetical protein
MQEDKVNTAAESRGLVKSPQDMFAGLFIIAFGLFCLWASSNLTGGRGANLGPGSFPRGLSFLLMAVGAIIVVQALTAVGPRLEAWSIRGPLFVLGAVLLFAATIRGTSLNIPGICMVNVLPPLGRPADADRLEPRRQRAQLAADLHLRCGDDHLLHPAVQGCPAPADPGRALGWLVTTWICSPTWRSASASR